MAKTATKKKPKEAANKPPVQKYRVGGVTASVWENVNDDKTSFSVTFEKDYKDENDEWQKSSSYFPSDLLSLSKAADLAHTYILERYDEMKEEDEAAAEGEE